jgi:hypothetical protein
MNVYSGHPEKYGELQDRIGELVYDSKDRLRMLSDEEIEKLKGPDTLWVAMD